ncbi:hypothetical protein JK361_07790 [Streptomyces sp. 5-8]|uniref:DUF676 domain-containing protein n=1 Tax=Streptomyces musisoli TaxID=2802280 RepID=A0ABS1NWW9_9ACTN|nr:hypothetical protein [Streptomyces musisoli]MBL1104499.1 hypothetical protein [Streptomyces musisoli]
MAQQAEIHVSRKIVEGVQAPSGDQPVTPAPHLRQQVWFATEDVRAGTAPSPTFEWSLQGAYAHEGKTATGTAHVFLAPGHRNLERPLILADGFNYGPSDLPGLWKHFDKKEGGNFLTRLRDSGIDVILLGFDERHTYIQANAGVAVACIERAASERIGSEPLIVGGVSMGGMITRYALARMESEDHDHQTGTYFSWDTPHNGAWIPLILQQMAYFFESFIPEEPGHPKQAELIRSPAAQQLLWAWVENSKYEGPVATSSKLRTDFLRELASYGNFPMRPKKIGVANGHGAGVGLKLTPGETAFDWKNRYNTVSAKALVQPDKGESEPIGSMHIALEIRRSSTTAVPALDGVPGGTLGSFGMVAQALGIEVDERFDSTCFVPAVSAIALDFDPATWDVDPALDISSLDRDRSDLDDFLCDGENSPHSEPRRALTDFLVNHFTR